MSDEENKGFVIRDRRRFDASGNRRDDQDAAPESQGRSAGPEPRSAAPGVRPNPTAGRPGPGAGAPPRPRAQARPSATEAARVGARPPREPEAMDEEGGAVSFSEFLLSIATNALIHLGGDMEDGRLPGRVNLPLAAQHIDIIAMLAQKTRGNLDPDEQALLESLLYDLRMKYVAVAQAQACG